MLLIFALGILCAVESDDLKLTPCSSMPVISQGMTRCRAKRAAVTCVSRGRRTGGGVAGPRRTEIFQLTPRPGREPVALRKACGNGGDSAGLSAAPR